MHDFRSAVSTEEAIVACDLERPDDRRAGFIKWEAHQTGASSNGNLRCPFFLRPGPLKWPLLTFILTFILTFFHRLMRLLMQFIFPRTNDCKVSFFHGTTLLRL